MVNMEKEKKGNKWPSHAFTQPPNPSNQVDQSSNLWPQISGSAQGTSKGPTKEAPQSTCSRQSIGTEMVSPRRLTNGRSSATHKVTRLIGTKGPGILLIASQQQKSACCAPQLCRPRFLFERTNLHIGHHPASASIRRSFNGVLNSLKLDHSPAN
jgi:hypothetical protein